MAKIEATDDKTTLAEKIQRWIDNNPKSKTIGLRLTPEQWRWVVEALQKQ